MWDKSHQYIQTDIPHIYHITALPTPFTQFTSTLWSTLLWINDDHSRWCLTRLYCLHMDIHSTTTHCSLPVHFRTLTTPSLELVMIQHCDARHTDIAGTWNISKALPTALSLFTSTLWPHPPLTWWWSIPVTPDPLTWHCLYIEHIQSTTTHNYHPPVHFHTLTTPSLELVMIKHCEVWHTLMSVIMSWCPAGGVSGPLLGTSSLVVVRSLPYVSWITSVPSISRDLGENRIECIHVTLF